MRLAPFVWILPFVVLGACGGDEASGPPVIERFAAEPARVDEGATTTLSWSVSGAVESVVISTDTSTVVETAEAEGSFVTPPILEPTTFVLRATGPEGRAGASARVTVRFDTPVVTRFTVSPSVVTRGSAVVLAWSTENTDAVTISAGEETIVEAGAPEGSLNVHPEATTSYELLATGPGGEARATAVVEVEESPPLITSFAAMPSEIIRGERSTLRWTVLGAERVELSVLDGETVVATEGMSGTEEVAPLVSTTYALVATNPDGTDTATVTVTVSEPEAAEIILFEANPNPGVLGETTTLSYEVRSAQRVRILSGGAEVHSSTSREDTASVVVPLVDEVSRFTLEVSNVLGSVTEEIEVYAHEAPAVRSFAAGPSSFLGTGTVQVAWDVENVSLLELFANDAPLPGFDVVSSSSTTVDASGVLSVSVSETTRFVLVATSAAGVERRTDLVVEGTEEIESNDEVGLATPLDEAAGQVLGAIEPIDRDYYSVTVPEGASLHAETTSGPGACEIDTRLTLFAPDGLTELATDDDGGVDACSKIAPTSHAGAGSLAAGSYVLLVEATGTATGAYVLDYRIHTPVCGDAVREGSEECDDGNTRDGDGCGSTCRFELHPMVISPPGGTVSIALDDPNQIGVVAVDLTTPGQSIDALAADPGFGSCDVVDTRIELAGPDFTVLGDKRDGGPTGTQGVCAHIRPELDAFAADLAAERHYVVVRPQGFGTDTISLAVSVSDPICGNGRVETRANEACDDSNASSGDGCSATCQREDLFATELEPNDAQANANDTGLNGAGIATLQGENSPAGDDDVYRFHIPAGQVLRMEARTYSALNQPGGCNSQTTDTRIYLEQDGAEATMPGTVELAFNDDIDNANNVWCSRIASVQVAGGSSGADYYVRVQGWLDQAATSYFLDIEIEP